MIEVIGVKFKAGGKMYYFAPNGLNPAEGNYVVVDTARGLECGKVAARLHAVSEDSITAPLKPILRLATEADMEILERNKAYMADAFRICEERIAARELPMHLVDVECGFDSNKLIFYFTSESRVDFRELVKDLALAFHVRIELRQIGDRDEAKLLGGLGICGREFCCKGYLNNFQPISIKMAKEQGLALNPTKISGTCGRLMCCLRYESPVYEELMKLTPKTGSTVLLPGDPPVRAYVMEANLVTGNLRVKPENSDVPMTVHRDNVERLQDASRRMTKEDLREKHTPQKPAAAPAQKAEPAKQSQNAPKAEAAQPKPEQPKPQKQRPPRQKPQTEKQPQTEKPATAEKPPVRQPANAALHPEFGENRQRNDAPKPQPQPRRAAQPLDEMDLTEHRAVVEHPERAQQQAEQKADGARKPQRNQNRRYHHNNRGRRPKPDNNGGGTQG